MKGWIVVNGKLRNVPKFSEHIDRFIKSFAEQKIALKVKCNDEIPCEVSGTVSIKSAGKVKRNLWGDHDNFVSEVSATHKLIAEEDTPDFVLFWDKDVRLAYSLEQSFPVFNSPFCIEVCDDKSLTHHYLALAGIQTPRTIFAPKYYKAEDLPPEKFVDTVIKILGLPLVIKECFGSFGEGVRLAKSKAEIFEIISAIGGDKPYLFQEFVHTSAGRDLRVYVAGGVAVGGVVRENKNDFRAGASSGGVMTDVHLSNIEKEIAVRAANAVGATFCGVDILLDKNDLPIVCEVNSNAHFINFFRATGIDFSVNTAKTIKKILQEYE